MRFRAALSVALALAGSCTPSPITACNADTDCNNGEHCAEGICTVDGAEGEGSVGEGEGSAGEGEGSAGEGEGSAGEGEGSAGEGEGSAGEGEGSVGEGEGEGSVGEGEGEGSVAARCPIFRDTFDDVVDSGRWPVSFGGDGLTTGVVDGHFQVVVPPGATPGDFAGIHSAPLSLPGAMLTARLVAPLTSPDLAAFFIAESDASHQVGFFVSSSELFLLADGGVVTGFPFDPALHKNLRMLFSPSAFATFQASADGHTWTDLTSANAAGVNASNPFLTLSAGIAAQASGVAQWDDVVVADPACAACDPVFVDHFDDGAIDPAVWDERYVGAPGSSFGVAQDGASFVVPTTGGGSFAGIQTGPRFSLAGRTFEITVRSPPPLGSSETLYMLVGAQQGLFYGMQIFDSNLAFQNANNVVNVAFDPARMRHLRVRFGLDVALEASPDGFVWTPVASLPIDGPLDQARINIGLSSFAGVTDITPVIVDDATLSPACP